MAVICSALGITLLLSAVIVNALEVHEDNQKENPKRHRNENPRPKMIEVCEIDPTKTCSFYCSAGPSADMSKSLNYHWEENPDCQSIGISIEVSSTIYFPRFTIPADWLSGNFKLKELDIDAENIFEISQYAFAGSVFEWMQKLILNNVHLISVDTAMLQKLFVEQHFKHLSITKILSTEHLASATIELYTVSMSYLESNANSRVGEPKHLGKPIRSGNMSGVLIISLTIVSCMLSFALGLFIRQNFFNRKKNKISKNRVIFVIENEATCKSVNVQKSDKNEPIDS